MQANLLLSGKSIAVLMTDGAEESGYQHPRDYFEQRGAVVTTVAPKNVGGTIQMYARTVASSEVRVAEDLTDAHADDFDALLLPGGLLSQVWLRLTPNAMAFIGAFEVSGKPVLAINEAIALVKCGGVCPAGANRAECPCLVANNVITGGWAPDLPALEEALAEQLLKPVQRLH